MKGGYCSIVSVGVDSWGGQHTIVNAEGDLVELPYHYRDSSRPGFDKKVHARMSKPELYRITGEEQYKTALLHWWYSINKTDVHNAGSFSTHEQAVGNPFQNELLSSLACRACCVPMDAHKISVHNSSQCFHFRIWFL